MKDVFFSAPINTHEVIITRTIYATRRVVFKTVTDPLLVPQWWGPKRLTTKVHKMVVTPGGAWRILQWDQAGNEYSLYGVYHDVVIPERLVYTMEYEGMPGHATLVVDKFAEQNGVTIMTSQTIFQSTHDRDQMLQRGMEEGVIETVHRLNELIAKNEFQVEFEKEGQLE
jgi:uncharacterized protein YndB with AHSA1/START domain